MKLFRQDLRYSARMLLIRSLFTLFIVALAPKIGANATNFQAPTQDQEPFQVGRVKTKYDSVADTTVAQCGLVELGQGAPRLIVLANASFNGKEPKNYATFWLGLSSYKGGATRRTQRSFKEATTLYLTVDSTRLEIQVKDYRNDFYELNRLLAESARAEISREDLRKLLDATSVEGRWGEIEFKLSETALASLKDFISHEVIPVGDR
jgi:hypothetical protein